MDLTKNKQLIEIQKSRKFFWFKIIDEQLIWILLLFMILITSILIPSFFSIQNFLNLVTNSTILAILVIAESLCLILGKFDLSIESTMGLTALVGAILVRYQGFNSYLTWLIVLVLGVAIGLFNGVLIVKLGVNPFVQTLAMLIILRGAMLILTEGITIFPLPDNYRVFGATMVGRVPILVIILIIMYAFFIIVLERRQFGRILYATGSNANAAFISGINVNKLNIIVFTLSGLIAAFAGIVLSGRLNAVDNYFGKDMIFEVMAAAVIGGISLTGGRGRLLGALGGVLFLGLIGSMLTWLDVEPFWVSTVRGMVILLAVIVDAGKNKLREKVLMS